MVRLILTLTLFFGSMPARADRALVLFDISSSINALELRETMGQLDHAFGKVPEGTILAVWPWSDTVRLWIVPKHWTEGTFASLLGIPVGSGSTNLGVSLRRATEWSRRNEPFCLQAIVVVDGKPDDQKTLTDLLATLGSSDFLAILPTAHDGEIMQQSAVAFYSSRPTHARYQVRPFSGNAFLEVLQELQQHPCRYLGG